MPKEVIAIFDIGKTNKKTLLFDESLKLVYQNEQKFEEISDEDGFACDDIDRVETWIIQSLQTIIADGRFKVKAINFATYGASLMYIGSDGKRLTPVYNYLKPMPEQLMQDFYEPYGGVEEFSRKTASPALGMLNSGLQILWLKKQHPEIFKKTIHILHFPQYLSYFLTGKITSEYTSIGCHTAMWDFDKMRYHRWLENEKIVMPKPLSNNVCFPIIINQEKIPTGIGIHDSSASLVPYLELEREPFILISTGTWCIFMNPFNSEALTAEQLNNDTLCYLSAQQKQVKSSRLFLGYIHDVNTKRIAAHFNVDADLYKKVKPNPLFISGLLKHTGEDKCFFKEGMPADHLDRSVDLNIFHSFEEAYHRLIHDISRLAVDSLKLVTPKPDNTQSVYISGGFARNEIFVRLLTYFLSGKKVYTSEIENTTAMGAALVIWEQAFPNKSPVINLGLSEVMPFNY